MMAKKTEKYNVVWLKRDLRLEDHAPLAAACRQENPVLLLYILEPVLVHSHHYARRHWRFVWQSLQDMRQTLEPLGVQLLSVYAPVQTIFSQLLDYVNIKTVFSHQETGVNLTFRRDYQIADFFKSQGIEWHEFPTNAVQRGLMHRDGWRDKWKLIIDQQPSDPNLQQLKTAQLPESCKQKLKALPIPDQFKQQNMLFQIGGAANAWNTLDDFIFNRSRHYNDFISSPGLAPVGCSRLSPYITWGNISIRQIWNHLNSVQRDLDWQWAIRSFKSRLRWHCHFIQKFESEPRMEFENLNSGYDDIRNKVDPQKVDAWKAGNTGFPMVDASMRFVKATGYLNFRMRAMLVSFLTHHYGNPGKREHHSWAVNSWILSRVFIIPSFRCRPAPWG